MDRIKRKQTSVSKSKLCSWLMGPRKKEAHGTPRSTLLKVEDEDIIERGYKFGYGAKTFEMDQTLGPDPKTVQK